MTDEVPHTTPLPELPTGELPLGTELNSGQYRIESVIAAGGFGITYLARDNLNRDVALKECFPLGLAQRSSGRTVSAASGSTLEDFTTARSLFLREARLLAKLQHPNVVHVQTLFEENGTAYMAMDFIHGHDLHTVIDRFPEKYSPAKVVELAQTLLGALGYLHGEGLLHRDIKPSNIRIDQFGTPILIDFGAAKQETRAESRKAGSFRVVSDGYSPSEFYIQTAEQGPQSDLYSLGASLYYVITGEAPVSANARAQAIATTRPDPYEPLVGRFPSYDKILLETIDQSLAMSIGDRPPDADTWAAALNAIAPSTAAVVPPPPPPLPTTPATTAVVTPAKKGGTNPVLVGGGLAAIALAAGLSFVAGRQAGGEGNSTAEILTIRNQMQRVQAENDDLQESNQTLAEERASLQAARDAALDRAAELEDEIARLRSAGGTERDGMQEDIARLGTDLNTERARAAQLQEELDRLEERNLTLLTQMSELRDERDTMRVDLTRAERDVARLEDENARLRAEAGTAPVSGGGGCPTFAVSGQTFSFTGEQLFNPQTLTTTAGADVNLADCPDVNGVGFVNTAPNFTLQISGAADYNRLELEVVSDCDTTLLVNSAQADWFFNDDTEAGNLQPTLNLFGSASFDGRVDIWIGTYSGVTCQASVEVETWFE